MKKVRTLAVTNLVVFILHVALSYATNFKLINNIEVGQVSDRYESLFTPADITFSIWGVIYTALLAFCIYHVVMAFKKLPDHPANEETNRIGVWFISSNICTIAWLFAWTNEEIATATVFMFLQLITLIAMNLRLSIHNPYATAGSKIFTHFPLSIYFGWITIATIANISIYLVSINWDGFGWGYSTITWAQLMIGFAILITVIVVLALRNVFYGLVVIWALYGIIMKRESINPEEYSAIIQTAWVGIGVVGIICLIQLINNLSRRKRHKTFPLAQPVK